MAVLGFSLAQYAVVAFTEASSGVPNAALPVVVVLRGRRPRVGREFARAALPPNLGDSPWTSSWSDGNDPVRYSRTRGVVLVNQREYAQCADGRTLVVLADAQGPDAASTSVAVADLPVPRMDTARLASVLWGRLTSRLSGRGPYRDPQEQWLEQITRVPAVQAFLAAEQSAGTR